MLSSLPLVKAILPNLGPTDASQDLALGQCLAAANQAVQNYCHRRLEASVFTEYPVCPGTPDQPLRQYPIINSIQACTLIANSTLIVVQDPTPLMVGMPVVNAAGVQQTNTGVPIGATITAVDFTTSTVTISSAALSSGSVSLNFGISVFLDFTGFYGQGPTPFISNSTFLRLGVDYAIVLDGDYGTTGESGILRRLTYSSFGILGWPFFPAGGDMNRSTLTAQLPPAWRYPPGCLKVTYAAGYAPSNVPADLVQAVNMLSVWLWQRGPQGGVGMTSVSYEGASIAFATGALNQAPELGTTRQLLTHYRDLSI